MTVWGKLFGKYLLVTNTLSCGLMMAAGDVIQQRNDYLRKYNVPTYVMAASPNAERKFHNSRNSDDYIHDYERTKNMTIVGLLQGPFHHWFYMILDRVIPGKTALSVIKKTCLDQSIASPTCLGIFFIGLGLLEHRNIEEIREEMRLKLYDTLTVAFGLQRNA
ncbi:Mpv17-like protein 2 [Melipona quadrifasciata]|uniref:Mpv17-like protein 2 n=1 Tax=Melipona quadrifasciata TaxID=166423 RepID=A0A0M9A0F0_9HYME|nr:Mpv17-like protein 2 [Melipona quadrifasciata]